MTEYEYLPEELMSPSEASASAQAVLGLHRILREQYNREWQEAKLARRTENIRLNPDIMRRAWHGKK